MYTVKQTSEITGISGYTLRFYDKEGLFPHLNRDGQNRRLFSDEDLHNIETIQELREMGFSLAQIRSYLTAEEEGGMKRRRELLAEQMDRIRSELAAITRRMKKLQQAAEYYQVDIKGWVNVMPADGASPVIFAA
ncbi:MerR family transcriptional regulator [Cloacibacillus evryensis]|uniref:MerR family transcriptional regulator n=1 Tax=Cloacibacillus evryensis TaxID=508460 RepID=UPI00044BBC1F|nr:MerR family transcriptional regulator [Cloacibacillus evryensis]EXG78182.1 putative transcriptional regulator [Cloacibacillus evryensis DSM 19522]MCQ4762684.1 MerR family transcriptional regulator [Cloacibacillus evryensis]MEA5035854.1 MerR family transcriptional regulator [Cloacibacillus evryensis]